MEFTDFCKCFNKSAKFLATRFFFCHDLKLSASCNKMILKYRLNNLIIFIIIGLVLLGLLSLFNLPLPLTDNIRGM